MRSCVFRLRARRPRSPKIECEEATGSLVQGICLIRKEGIGPRVQRMPVMKLSPKAWMAISWAALGCFLLAAVATAAIAHPEAYGTRPSGTLLFCGNSVSDPICFVLAYGVPLLFGFNLLLAIQSVRGFLTWTQPAGLLTASIVCVSGFAVYSASCFHPLFGTAPVLESIWWIAPFF